MVRLCQAAGAIILAKENLEEFAAGATSNNPHYGAVHNPWALEHIPGGSSGGGGANVAACVTFASLGTDLGGSVRLPGGFLWGGGAQTRRSAGSVSAATGHQLQRRSHRPLNPVGSGQCAGASGHRRVRSAGPQHRPGPRAGLYGRARQELQGLRMGIPTNYYFDLLDPGGGGGGATGHR